jgi:hypothetical protein
MLVILSGAKDLLFATAGKQQVLRGLEARSE